MAIINRSNIKSLLQPMLDVVFFDYDVHPALWKNIYKQYHGDKAVQYEMEMEGLPLGQIKLEGGPVASGSMGQAYETAMFTNTMAFHSKLHVLQLWTTSTNLISLNKQCNYAIHWIL